MQSYLSVLGTASLLSPGSESILDLFIFLKRGIENGLFVDKGVLGSLVGLLEGNHLFLGEGNELVLVLLREILDRVYASLDGLLDERKDRVILVGHFLVSDASKSTLEHLSSDLLHVVIEGLKG